MFVIMHYRIARPNRTVVRLLVAVLVGSFISLFVIYRAATAPTLYRQTQFLLDTFVELTVVSDDKQDAYAAISAAFDEMRRVEGLLSRYSSDSWISAINQSPDKSAVQVDPEVYAILHRAQDYAALTHGAFDMTVGPLIDLWGIGSEHEQIPTAADLRRALQFVDYRYVTLSADHRVARRYPEVTLDLGGIAKGYSIDRGIATLQQHDISGALLNAGGDIRGIGVRPDGAPWRIGIQHPRHQSDIIGVTPLHNAAIATSGDYERYFIDQETRYHHLLVPQTGMPARDCQSVTILAPTAEAADAFATAVFIMGPERGMHYIETHQELEGMIIRADGTLLPSSGFYYEAK